MTRPNRSGLRALLGILGRQAHWALPTGVFVGIVLPDVAALLRPIVTAAVIGTLTIALLRLDWNHLGLAARRPLVQHMKRGKAYVAAKRKQAQAQKKT